MLFRHAELPRFTVPSRNEHNQSIQDSPMGILEEFLNQEITVPLWNGHNQIIPDSPMGTVEEFLNQEITVSLRNERSNHTRWSNGNFGRFPRSRVN